MAEKSSFLHFFDNKNIGKAYGTIAQERDDLQSALFVLTHLLEQMANENMSVAFVRQDLMLMRAYFQSRKMASADADYFGFFKVCERMGLNQAEEMLLYVAVCMRFLNIPSALWNKLRELRGEDIKCRDGAIWLYQAVTSAMEQEGEPARSAVMDLLFSAEGPKGGLSLRRELIFVLESGRLSEEAEYVSQRFCRRMLTGEEKLPKLIFHEELLQQFQAMAQTKTQTNAQNKARKKEQDKTENELDAGREAEDWTLCIKGERGSGKTLLAAHLGSRLGRNIMILEGERLADYKKETAVYFQLGESREWFFEWLVQVILHNDLVVLKQVEDADRRLIRSFVKGLLIVLEEKGVSLGEDTGKADSHWQDMVQYELSYPDISEKTKLWDFFLQEYPHDKKLDTMALSSKYVLNAGGIREALFTADAHARGLQKKALGLEDIVWAIRQSQAGGLGQFAQPVKCIFEWDDLVVEDQVKKQMRYVCAQIQYKYKVGTEWGFYEKMPYGRGVSALFYGPPGTGKTMAAQVMAKELGYDLYRVDLSQMVSKYIGETEKNITELFERARHMNVILFFDEADALFSKRSEVKDAHDRNANTEVAHLLQQMEAYEGILILATNLKDNMDDAFKRRIKFMINFSLPSAEIRKKLWHSILPAKVPCEESLDLDFFAQKFELSGSQIKDVLVNAAFMAAEQNMVLSNEHIKEALSMNYQKAGKMLTKNDFGYLG